jgi:hypothetical protein
MPKGGCMTRDGTFSKDLTLAQQEEQLSSLIVDYSRKLKELNHNKAKVSRRLAYLKLELERIRLLRGLSNVEESSSSAD